MIEAVSNSNFTFLAGRSVVEGNDPKYIEYRRQWSENPKKFILREFPVHLDIEATNRCNLKCTFCDKLPYLTQDQMGDMDFRLYRKILDESKHFNLCSVKLSYRGETLLHPKIAEMVEYAKRQGVIDIYFNTNGMLLTEKMILQLIDAGLDRISVSVEGTDPENFERERRGARFSKILENIDHLMELRSQKGVQHPKVRVQTVALPGIDLAEYAEYWQPHCDEVAAIDYKEAGELERNKFIEDFDWACPQLWQRMTIEWDGRVIPCNNDDYGQLSPGNVKEKTIYECWHARTVDEARELHKEGRSHMVKACNGCPWRTTQILKKGEQNDA